MNNFKKAFTLVELVVVITILAILGTIAFVSLRGYSSDARNSKRISDLKSIKRTISTRLVNGYSLISFIADSSSAGSFSIAGTSVVLNADYRAGLLNYTTMNMKSDDFLDPSTNNDYPVGVTIKKDGEFEIAASMENGSGNKNALIVGTYIPRKSLFFTTELSFTGKNITVYDDDIDKIKRGDKIIDNNNNVAIVSFLSSNAKIITVDSILNGTSIKLYEDETLGLIKEIDTGTDPVTNNSILNLPY